MTNKPYRTCIALTSLLLLTAICTARASGDDNTANPPPCTLVNGDFDDGLAGWSTDGDESIQDPVQGHPAPARKLAGFGAHSILIQPLELSAGTPTTITVWARSASTGTEIIDYVWLDVHDEFPTTWPPVHTAFWRVSLDDQWREYSTSFTPDLTAQHALRLRVATASDQGDPDPDDVYLLWFDAISIECAPNYLFFLPLIGKTGE